MPSPFAQTTRALEHDRALPALVSWAVAALLLAAWATWFTLGRLQLVEVSRQARVEVSQAAHPLASLHAGRVLTSHLQLGRQVSQGEVLLELDAGNDSLRWREEKARRDALGGQLTAVGQQLEALVQASLQDEQAMYAARQAAELRLREAGAAADFASQTARRLQDESQLGAVAAFDARQALAQVRALAADRDAQAADLHKLVATQQAQAAHQRAATEALRRQQAALRGDIATQGATLERLQADIERQRLRAPVAGTLAEVAPIRTGEVVAAGQRLASVVPAGELRIVAEFDPATVLGRVHEGLSARVRLSGFPWAQYGSLDTTVSRVAGELRDGMLRVELAPRGPAPDGIRLQHGMPGTVEVLVDTVSPAVLLWRAAGQGLSSTLAPPAHAAALSTPPRP